MSFTQIEKQIITALGEHGAMGLIALMPKVPGLEGKVQLKNILLSLAQRQAVKQQGNSQWRVLKATYEQYKKEGQLDLDAPAKPLDDIPSFTKKVEPKVAKAAPSQTPAPVPLDPAPVTLKPDAQEQVTESSAIDVLQTLMNELPEGAALAINNDGITVFWNGNGYEPAIGQVNQVLDAICVLQGCAA